MNKIKEVIKFKKAIEGLTEEQLEELISMVLKKKEGVK